MGWHVAKTKNYHKQNVQHIKKRSVFEHKLMSALEQSLYC